ncbi:MAG: hypothetical protein IKB75_01640 [Clostridia bacterium]|nr:hypothetical protein [Clostridia bacterium]
MIDFIPNIWSETMLTELKRRYIGIANCLPVDTGDVKGIGCEIKLCGLYNVGVSDYDSGNGTGTPSNLTNYTKSVLLEQAKCFNFMMDDMEKTQVNAGLMKLALSKATDQLANLAEQYVYNLCDQTTNAIVAEKVTADNIVDALLSARTALFKKQVFHAEDIVFEVSPEVAELIYKAKLTLGDAGEMMENGCIGRFMGSQIYVTNQIATELSINGGTSHRCIVRTKRAVAFAEALSEIVAYRPENFFSDAIKGLHVYGASVIYPNELYRLEIEILSEQE